MFQTVWGSLNQALELSAGEILLICGGGTSSTGMLACQLAKSMGVKVISITRNLEKEKRLKDNGSDQVLIDNGYITETQNHIFPEGVNKILELIVTKTLKDYLK